MKKKNNILGKVQIVGAKRDLEYMFEQQTQISGRTDKSY